ncbi:MAG: signal peptidase I [Clostridiales bacterium]|nr:signal peptidase I [Clostridiales bacterium]
MQAFNEQLLNKKEEQKHNLIETVVFFVLCIVLIFSCFYFFTYSIKEVVVSGPSMEKTLYNGDVLYLSVNKEVKIGDVVVISGEKTNWVNGTAKDEWIIKRVIGLGGDTIEIKDGYVYRNGQKLEEDYKAYGPTAENDWKTKTLKDNEVFYLGDNRRVSADSRSYFNTCTIDQIVGVVSNASIKLKGISTFFYKNVKQPILKMINGGV